MGLVNDHMQSWCTLLYGLTPPEPQPGLLTTHRCGRRHHSHKSHRLRSSLADFRCSRDLHNTALAAVFTLSASRFWACRGASFTVSSCALRPQTKTTRTTPDSHDRTTQGSNERSTFEITTRGRSCQQKSVHDLRAAAARPTAWVDEQCWTPPYFLLTSSFSVAA